MEGHKIERKSSMEIKEPPTLSLDQINYAREAALYVLSTHSIEGAIRIFTEGLQPVPSVKHLNMNMNMNMNMMMDSDEEDGEISDRIAVDHVLAGPRDTVTAPF